MSSASAPWGREGQSKVLLSCLPFLGEVSDATGIYVMMRTSFTAFLLEAAQMFVLAFIINLLQDLLDRFIKLGGSSWLTHFFVIGISGSVSSCWPAWPLTMELTI